MIKYDDEIRPGKPEKPVVMFKRLGHKAYEQVYFKIKNGRMEVVSVLKTDRIINQKETRIKKRKNKTVFDHYIAKGYRYKEV